MNFENIEDAIITRIQSQVTYLKTVETYAGQLEDDEGMMAKRFPTAFVVYGGSDFEWVDGITHAEKATFGVLCCAKNLRGQAEARKGDAAGKKGAYDIRNDVLTALTGQKLGLDMEKLRPVKCQLILVSGTVAVYGIDFETQFDTTFS